MKSDNGTVVKLWQVYKNNDGRQYEVVGFYRDRAILVNPNRTSPPWSSAGSVLFSDLRGMTLVCTHDGADVSDTENYEYWMEGMPKPEALEGWEMWDEGWEMWDCDGSWDVLSEVGCTYRRSKAEAEPPRFLQLEIEWDSEHPHPMLEWNSEHPHLKGHFCFPSAIRRQAKVGANLSNGYVIVGFTNEEDWYFGLDLPSAPAGPGVLYRYVIAEKLLPPNQNQNQEEGNCPQEIEQ